MCYFYKGSQIFEFIWSHVFTTRNTKDMESQKMEHLLSIYNPLVLRVKFSSHVFSNWVFLFFLQKYWKNSFIGLYTYISIVIYKKMSITGARKSFQCEKPLRSVTRFCELKKHLIVVFQVMVCLYIEICFNFIIFNI